MYWTLNRQQVAHSGVKFSSEKLDAYLDFITFTVEKGDSYAQVAPSVLRLSSVAELGVHLLTSANYLVYCRTCKRSSPDALAGQPHGPRAPARRALRRPGSRRSALGTWHPASRRFLQRWQRGKKGGEERQTGKKAFRVGHWTQARLGGEGAPQRQMSPGEKAVPAVPSLGLGF